MTVTLTNLDGSGHLKNNSVSAYSYSEEVTSLDPTSISGGVSQVNLTGVAVTENKVDNTHPNTAISINNTMELSDTKYGSVQFQNKKVSIANGLASITGETLMARLNVTKTAEPHGGSGSSILTAINYYCSLVGIFPNIDETFTAELDAIDVNFLGWTGNVWEQLKLLCAAVSASPTDNVGIEMYISGSDLVFRKAKNTATTIQNVSSESYSIDAFNSAKNVEVIKYETTYGVNKVVREQERQLNGLFTVNESVSITDSMQVEAGQIITKRFLINASLSDVKQPTCVAQIFPLPYSGTTGQYVVVGNDDLPIQPSQWLAQGGNLEVRLTDNPYEIEITVTAPPAASLPTNADPSKLTYAPYKIGVESSGDQDYPALYIVGSGVFFTKKTKTFVTGADDDFTQRDTIQTIDNIFITTDLDQNIRGVAAAQAACGPSISLAQTSAGNLPFGSTVGGMHKARDNKFRIMSASYSPSSVSLTSVPCASFSDFNQAWSGQTFTSFKNFALDEATAPQDALKFNEFSVIPLARA